MLCECDPPGEGVRSGPLRLEHEHGASRWFPWSRVSVDALDRVGRQAGLATTARWEDGGRWFAHLEAT